MPFISIITPTYNRKVLLEKAILSVISQDQSIPFEWEMIIIDDGGDDKTKEYITSYLKKYQNIRYKHIQNVGMNNARNIGFDMMSPRSDFTIFLDSDDELKENCISTCLSKFEQRDRDKEKYL